MTDTATRSALAVTLDPVALGIALQAVVRAISTRTTLPILSNVLLETTDEGLALTTTNLEIGIRKVVPAEVASPGSTTVPARLLTDFVTSLPATSSLSLTLDGALLGLRCGRFDTHIRCMPAEEFPPGPQPDGGDRLTIPMDGLLRSIERTLIAASTDEARPVLTGILLEIAQDGLTLAATDGHRLAVSKLARTAGEDDHLEQQGARLIVPARAFAELARVFRGESGDIELLVSPARNQAWFRAGTSEVTSRLIDGQYPNYHQVIPNKPTTVAVASTADLVQAVRAVGLFGRDSANCVRFHVHAGGLRVEATASEIGDGLADLDADVAGPELTIAFNAKYVLDALGVSDRRVSLQLAGPLSPAVLSNPEVDGTLHVVMPVRTAS